MALLSQLPYLHVTRIARKRDAREGQFVTALQLVPRPTAKVELSPEPSAVLMPA
jgi:hypothetical protein